MRTAATIRVAHPFAHFAKGWGIARSATALLCLVAAIARAQAAPCGLTSITEVSALTYPPIAKAAHLEGNIILLATFDRDGTVTSTKLVGPPSNISRFLGEFASNYVKGWRANPYSGPRQCPVVVSFVLGHQSENPKTFFVRTDPQHVQITAEIAPPTIEYSVASK